MPSTFTTHFRSAIAFGRLRILTEEGEKVRALECLARKYSPDDLDEAGAEIRRAWDRFCANELAIERLTGKAAIELLKKRGPGN